MITSNKHINIQNLLEVKVLSNRNTAVSLFKEIEAKRNEKVVLDFTGIEFASRSFMDELNSLINDDTEREYVKENMSDQVNKMDLLVSKSNNKSESNEMDREMVQI